MSESDIRYGFYLRPSAAMSQAQVMVHELLAHQYNLHVAGRFMPHATVKGFFKSAAPVSTMIERLDTALAGCEAFPVYNRGVIEFGSSGIALNIHETPEGQRNEPLQALHQRALAALMPLVDEDCVFTQRDWLGERYFAHLTLAMADIPQQFFPEIVRFVRELEPIGPPSFLATTLHLYEFTSRHWTSQWGGDFTWKLLHAWALPGA